jgi:uncharacterized membrane protein YcaP (DUF421 family)
METVIRILVMYVFVMSGLRISGKRTFGQLTPADLVLLMMIPELFAQAMLREDFSMINALIAVSTLLLVAMLTETLTYRFKSVSDIVNGTPVTVVSKGQLRPDRMDPERLSAEEIMDAMHRVGLERIEQVKWAVLYPDGTVAVVPWKPSESRPNPEHADPM